MGRVRRFISVAVVGIVMAAAPATAQTSPTSSTTTTTTKAATATTTTPSPSSTTTTTSPATVGDAPPESVPDVPITVPPRDPPAEGVAPLPGRVVTVNLRGARASALARQAAYAEAVALRTRLEQDLAQLQDRVGKLAVAARQAIVDLAKAKRDLTARAVDAYVRGNGFDTVPLDPSLEEPEAQRTAMLGFIVDLDRQAVARVKELQAKVTVDQAQTAKQLTETQSQLERARIDEAQAELNLFDAKLDLAVSSAGGSLVIHGFVFPVADPHTFTPGFGDVRMPDTEFFHLHEGCDVAAPEAAELYAAERGVITQISSSFLGGQQLWLKGESNTSYYYAHLSAYAPDLRAGQLVEAGELVGFVGHTGNAYGPHLHFEVHPGGGSAIDPYPLLLVADQQRKSPP